MIGGFRVAFGANGTGLLVRIADRLDRQFASQGLIQMHCPAAGDQEDVLHTLFRNKADHVIGKFHRSNLKWDSGTIMERRKL